MLSEKNQQEKAMLHPRNKNRESYDLRALTMAVPELKKHVSINKFGIESIDFSNPIAVRLLNKALLNYYYGIKYWEFPAENLCPPIPGRADYINHIADLLAENNLNNIPTGDKVTCLDVGVGASCIYPIIGVTEYGWKFVGSDIDSKSIASAQKIVNSNASLQGKVDCRLQKNAKNIFQNILDKADKIDLTLCNPPFHASVEDAQKGTRRKIKNLTGKNPKTPVLNFAGIKHELIVEGGEYQFIQNMIRESKKFSQNCYWFTTLVSKQANLKGVLIALDKIEARQVKTIALGTTNKSSRIVAWTFLSREEQKAWREARWNKST
ncbi:MAG: 23S rRNA (adenine(1618)-N(6))-methyltransferase RlmF [Bacteroidales bacterium]|nr:23S rRNA (adenine(1618)-N(6))-methyltransferase RlmF [Bacteroidales bacterium]